MKNIYQAGLEILRDPSNIRPLTSVAWSYCTEEIAVENKAINNLEKKPSLKPQETTLKKAEALDALYEFGKDKLEANEEKSFKFSGGEIAKKVELSGHELEASKRTKEAIVSIVSGSLGHIVAQNIFKHIGEKVKVIFVADSFKALDALEDKSQFDYLFSDGVSQLFEKMVGAMKLEHKDFILFGLQTPNGESLISDFADLIFNFRPEYVVSLGAQATHKVLNIKDRLKDIHGSFYPLNSVNDDESVSVEVMPLFSPNLLATAPNMKKTAWKDMQLLMDRLGISS